MRSRAVAATFAVLLAACGGNYSNADVEFAAAIPRRADVTVSTPLTTALTAQGLREAGVTSLAVGDPSSTAAQTRNAVKGLDDMAGFFVGLLEQVLKVDPTERTPDLRVWGPFRSPDLGEWEVQLRITRQPVQIDINDPRGPIEGFAWQVQYKKKSAATWNDPALAEGFYEPGKLRHGRGAVTVKLAEARAAGLPLGTLDPTLTLVALGYDTRTGQPHAIQLYATNSLGTRAGVLYAALPDGAGFVFFDLYQSDLRADHIQAASRWTSSGAGRGDMGVVSGLFTGSRAVECWDAAQTVVFVNNPWESDFGGDESRCAFPPP